LFVVRTQNDISPKQGENAKTMAIIKADNGSKFTARPSNCYRRGALLIFSASPGGLNPQRAVTI
jgi:hypothetical protein